MDARARAEFEEFVAARSARLFRTAVLLTGDRQEAQDLVQSALERAWRHWDKVAAAEQPEAYVRRILVNSLKDRRRDRRRIVEVPLDDARPPAAAGPSPYGRVDQRGAIVAELRRLPAGMRAVLVLRYFEDLTEAEIARALNCSAGTVKSQAARGLTRLRAALGPAAEGLSPAGPPGPDRGNQSPAIMPGGES